MVHYEVSAARAITDYFNSPAFHAPKEAELLAVVTRELMQSGKPASHKAIIASVISRLESEVDEALLQGYRNLLSQLLQDHPP
ncbi:biofilm development regulator YmgB/AriR family protein [Erwinia mallotivora]|uniref:biofilm development regulator YmgB/AriR family protein n=1 Tax=Erwinia mallotivora TaxID=69222 RepID=UPI0035ED81C5